MGSRNTAKSVEPTLTSSTEPREIVTRIGVVPGGSIEYTLDEKAVRAIADRSKLREIAEEAVRLFLLRSGAFSG